MRTPKDIFNNIVKRIEEKKCQVIIKVGKNKGKMCNRIKCNIIGHEKYVENIDDIGKCKVIIKRGRNKKTMCGRYQCIYHRCLKTSNIATYLKLPKIFEDIVVNNRYDYNGLRHIYNNNVYIMFKETGFFCEHQTFLIFENIFEYMNRDYTDNDTYKKILISLIDHICKYFLDINKDLKILLFIIILKLLDTKHGKILLENEKFRKTVCDKITYIINELKLDYENNKFYINYIEENFETDGIMLSKNSNKKIEKIKKCFENLLVKKYNDTLERMYVPGGIGYFKAFESFISTNKEVLLCV